ncbi:TetR/AcrR family transcriptional regulator C-terminal domain-containing protein [Burkholderia sp. MR1-5-21]
MPAPSPVERNDKTLAVLNAATTVFLAEGFSAATTDMIQREAGVSKATMYTCFSNKEAMFAAVIERECAVMSGAVRAIRAAPGNVARTLTDIGTSYLKIILPPPALSLFRVVAAEAPRFPNLGRQFYLAGPSVIASVVSEQLTGAAQAGEIDIQSVGIHAAAAQFISLLRGEALLECLMHPDSQPSAAQVDHWVRQAVTTFLGAFGMPRPPKRASAQR